MRAAIICTITMLGIVPVAAQTAIAPTPMAAPTIVQSAGDREKTRRRGAEELSD